jgi:hypothetical protein
MQENQAKKSVLNDSRPNFKRTMLRLKEELSPARWQALSTPARLADPPVTPAPVSAGFPSEILRPCDEPCTALIVNGSHRMAKEISLSLSLRMPNCSIMYAPTLQLAAWMVRRRKIDLVVSDALLPDGAVQSLLPILKARQPSPDLVVLGDLREACASAFRQSGYRFSRAQHFTEIMHPEETATNILPLNERVRALGKDIRNDLNNPLQEIVAMVFVAQASAATIPTLQPTTAKALDAIDRAAKNMAVKIKALEDRIHDAVQAG